MIPGWLADKRSQTCLDCEKYGGCPVRWDILQNAPKCPLNKLPSKDEEIAARAWPQDVDRISGCCDSAENY